MWVPGDNKAADSLYREEGPLVLYGPESFFVVPKYYLGKQIRLRERKQKAQYWNNIYQDMHKQTDS